MTDANGKRNPLDRPPLARPIAPIGDQSGDQASSRASSRVSNLTGDKTTGLSDRRSRRELVRKRSGATTNKTVDKAEGTRSTAGRRRGTGAAEKPTLEKSRADRVRRKAGDRRSSKVTPLALAKGAGTKTRASTHPAARSAGQTTSFPSLGLARRRSSRRKAPLPLLYLGRLAIAGLGIAVIGGTLLKVLPNNTRNAAIADSSLSVSAKSIVASFPITLNQEIAPLKAGLQALPNRYPGLTPKVFYVDVDTRDYADLEGSDAIAAASTIKLPVLLAFFEEVDAGRIALNQTVALLPEQIAEGSGEIQLSAPGTKFTALEVATQMIVGSDNTATNMMIDLLGGPTALNQRFKGYGLQKTQIVSPLPDLQGTNITSAKDLVHTMLLISGDRLTLHSRDRILNILNRTHNKTLLADGMAEREALTYNKTGDIELVLGDVALVDLSNGKRYIVAALVERPSNDGRAVDLIHSISGLVYKNADEAVQPAITPLGDPSAVEGAPKSVGEDAPPAKTSTPPAAQRTGQPTARPTEQPTARPTEQPEEMPAQEEDPYPSANPSRRNSPGTN